MGPRPVMSEVQHSKQSTSACERAGRRHFVTGAQGDEAKVVLVCGRWDPLSLFLGTDMKGHIPWEKGQT